MSLVCLRSVSGQSQVSLRSVSGLEALLTHFVVQSEPKILRLVYLIFACPPEFNKLCYLFKL